MPVGQMTKHLKFRVKVDMKWKLWSSSLSYRDTFKWKSF